MWDMNLTWYAEVPDFTECFQQVVFVMLPHLILCVLALPHILYIKHFNKNITLPWTVLNTTKTVICACLICILLCYLALKIHQKFTFYVIPDVVLCSVMMQVIGYVTIMFILQYHRCHGIESSTFLFAFWFVTSLCCSVVFRSMFLKIMYKEYSELFYDEFLFTTLYCPLVWCECILAWFTDRKKSETHQLKSPLQEKSFISLLTFGFMNRVIRQSQKKLLTVGDFPPLSMTLESKKQCKCFNQKWMQSNVDKFAISEDNNHFTFSTMILVLLKSFWAYIFASIAFELAYDVVRMIPPLLLDLVIQFIDDPEEYEWRGYFYCVTLFVTVFLTSFLYEASLFYPTLLALQMKSAFISAAYQKALRLSNSAKQKYTCGEMMNLISVDVEKIFDFVVYFPLLIGAPLRIILTIVFLWQYLGPSCLAGMASVLLMLPLSAVLAKLNHTFQVKQMKLKDDRLKLLSELLSGIKLLKLFAWEKSFLKKVTDVRKKEVKCIRNIYFNYAGSSFLWGCSPFLIAVTSFATFVSVDERNILHPSTAFVSLNLILMIKSTLFLLPEVLSKAVQISISLKRLMTFLASEEYDMHSVGEIPDEGDAVTIRDATLSWGPEEPILKELNLHVKKGSLVAVIGAVGSGKSSLLSALLGVMQKMKGSIDILGKVAYVSQQAWMQNKTVQENILFMRKMDEALYKEVLRSCCLNPDLKVLPAHDQTEIGERGVNMSGGQKQRISLARAIYHCADVYLLDDPLSAVDAHVGKHIFQNVIGSSGMLKDKTRIIVTHNESILPEADIIVTMKDGQIEEIGTYDDLIGHNGPFADLILKHATVSETANETEKTTNTEMNAFTSNENISNLPSPYQSVSSLSSLTYTAKIIDEEQMAIGKVKKQVYLNYMNHGGIIIVIASIFAFVGYQAFEIGSNIWVSEWTGDSISMDDSKNDEMRKFRIGIYAVLGLGQAICVVCSTSFLSVASANASRKYHIQMLWAIFKAPMSFFDTTPLGRVMNRFSKDIDRVDNELLYQIDGWFATFCAVVGTFIVIAMTTPEFLVALIPMIVIFYYLQELYLVASRQLARLESSTRSPILSHFSETFKGLFSIKAYKVEKQFIDILEKRTDININCYFCWTSSSRWLSFRLDVISSFIVLISSVLCVFNKATLNGALVGLSLNYALTVTSFLTWLIRTGTEIESKIVSIERIEEYSKIKPEAPWHIPECKPHDAWPEQGSVTFQQYSTRYREKLDLVLHDLNLAIHPGEKVGIVGRTGAGKSSLTMALFRIVEPAHGSIIIDGIDISKIGLYDLRSKLTIIPQDPILFTGTLRSNLDPNDEQTDEEIWCSLENANVKSHISSLPQGLFYNIAEGGENLSVGQRQLICFARALLRRTNILILDEATASVDVETDSLIQHTIKSAFHSCTVITIAHRINTILDYDRVVVMEDGNISEIGPPPELLKDPSSKFHQLSKNAGII